MEALLNTTALFQHDTSCTHQKSHKLAFFDSAPSRKSGGAQTRPNFCLEKKNRSRLAEAAAPIHGPQVPVVALLPGLRLKKEALTGPQVTTQTWYL